MSFVEFNTVADGTVLIRMENISLVKKNPPEYPKFQTTYSVFVGRRGWTLHEEEGQRVYDLYKEWLIGSRVK